MTKIDLEKFACSAIKYFESKKISFDGSDFLKFNRYITIIQKLLKEQGLEYKDGAIVEIDPEQESKFKNGDWVVNNNGNPQVSQVTALSWPDSKIKGADDNFETFINTATLDKQYHLWTIQDAKDGDVLATLDYILVFKEFLKNDGGISYCHYDFGAGNPQFIWTEDKNWYFGKEAIIHPATKEQRDLLFQKMKEAGYEWDAEKKELKKIVDEEQIKRCLQDNSFRRMFEQKPAAQSEEDEKIRNWLITLIKSNEYGSISNVGKMPCSKLNVIVWLEKQNKQKSSWSEEDEKMFNAITNSLNREKIERVWHTAEEDISNWFKGLKGRVQPQNFTVTDEELAQAKKDAYNDALDKIEYHSGEPTFDDGWSAAIWYLKKRNAQPR